VLLLPFLSKVLQLEISTTTTTTTTTLQLEKKKKKKKKKDHARFLEESSNMILFAANNFHASKFSTISKCIGL
jgi:hypothetical protein